MISLVTFLPLGKKKKELLEIFFRLVVPRLDS